MQISSFLKLNLTDFKIAVQHTLIGAAIIIGWDFFNYVTPQLHLTGSLSGYDTLLVLAVSLLKSYFTDYTKSQGFTPDLTLSGEEDKN